MLKIFVQNVRKTKWISILSCYLSDCYAVTTMLPVTTPAPTATTDGDDGGDPGDPSKAQHA